MMFVNQKNVILSTVDFYRWKFGDLAHFEYNR